MMGSDVTLARVGPMIGAMSVGLSPSANAGKITVLLTLLGGDGGT